MDYCSRSAAYDTFMRGFEAAIPRGPDDSRVIDTGKGYSSSHRSAIMGLHDTGVQPLQSDKGYAVCNGEMYGFEELRNRLSRKYEFRDDSDCKIILPMYKEYGVAMFVMLDTEFACIIYDGEREEYIAARDPIGIRPLYYDYDKREAIIFTSEPKNLVGIAENIMPFPPGHYYKDGKLICYLDISTAAKICEDDLEKVCRDIRKELVSGVEKRLVADAKVGFLLSGGLDSSLVCAIAAKKREDATETSAIGMCGDAIDLRYAKQVANHIESDHTEIFMTPDDVITPLKTMIYVLGTLDITTIRASIGMYLVCKATHEKADIKVLLIGEISDELFGHRYADFAPDEEILQLESQKRIKELHMYNVLQTGRCISVNSLEARAPFGDIDFVKYVVSIDPKLKVNQYGKGKYLLHHAFEDGDYLPDKILWREEVTFSDAAGYPMVDYLRAYAEEIYTDMEFKDKYKSYDHAQPFTEESLLYREVFEECYTGQSKVIVDFWIPNRERNDCHVNDPSARVLSNYGDGGI